MKYQVGQRLDGVVNNVTDLGVFVTLPGRRSGLLHRNDFGSSWQREKPRFKEGQEVRVVIQNIRKGRLDLSLSRVNDPDLPDPTNQFTSLKAKDFSRVLNEVDQKAQEQIKKIEASLN